MKFSVIIPLYNKAPYVAEALHSVLAQTYKEFEVIVVDDGSTDDSLEKVQKFKSSKVQIISQKNSGVSTARNNGVKLAKNPYICFLDADDWWAPTFLEEMKSLIEQFPKAGIYGSGYYIVKGGKNKIAPVGVESDFNGGIIDYCKVYSKTLCMPLTSISVVMPKYIFEEQEGFKPKLKLGEDFDLWVRIALKYPVAFLNKPLAYYNQDVDIKNRAVGTKLYKPQEHMLFTDYGEMMKNDDFRFLYERLALYSLLPYYLRKVNEKEVNKILKTVDWSKHEKKYYWYYNRLPKQCVRFYFFILKKIVRLKQNFKIWRIK